jgi:hypothetical protein
MGAGDIKPTPPLDADDDLLRLARQNCARRSRDRGEVATADALLRGDNDDAGAIRHEVNRLRTEAAAAAERRAAAEDNLDLI